MDDVLGVPEAERIDWKKFWRESMEREENEAEEEKGNDEFQRPENAEPLGVEMDELVGMYRNEGYHEFVLQMKDGMVVADFRDRCFGFDIVLTHLTGMKFLAETVNSWLDERGKMGAEIKSSAEKREEAIGIELEWDMKGTPIWFERIE